MGKPYSKDLRSRFVRLLDSGLSASAAGRHLLIARSTATRWSLIWRTEQRCEALPMGGDQRSAALEEHASFILSQVEEQPDIFLHEIVAALASKDVSTSEDAISRLLARHGITRKKRPSSLRRGNVTMSQRPAPNGSKP